MHELLKSFDTKGIELMNYSKVILNFFQMQLPKAKTIMDCAVYNRGRNQAEDNAKKDDRGLMKWMWL